MNVMYGIGSGAKKKVGSLILGPRRSQGGTGMSAMEWKTLSVDALRPAASIPVKN